MPLLEITDEASWKKKIQSVQSDNVKANILLFCSGDCGPSHRIRPFISEIANSLETLGKQSPLVFLELYFSSQVNFPSWHIPAIPSFILFTSSGDKICDIIGASRERLIR